MAKANRAAANRSWVSYSGREIAIAFPTWFERECFVYGPEDAERAARAAAKAAANAGENLEFVAYHHVFAGRDGGPQQIEARFLQSLAMLAADGGLSAGAKAILATLPYSSDRCESEEYRPVAVKR